ncbi:hypothetical protein [Psychrobacillus sp. FJAT-21963]|uniref:hypothetical protein n=1 Tax=Psychrobacillus sp. FJAT-21963 TaxID=1712028 RepID=UPI0006F53AD0|nr:hypothetical protein [Psychrobacillus sp. FJAT-21963]KQL33343.1 hypothetical protein AN959_17425 [Psychrobacillus sp. FJAT-21963]
MFDLRMPIDLEHMEVVNLIESPTVEGLAILFLGENLEDNENNKPTIRVYLLKRIQGIFEIEKELYAFSFYNVNKALTFADNLPQMSALELLIDMNSVNQENIIH